jgi:hypothetical protein
MEIRVKTLPWSIWLKTLKWDLMKTVELTANKLKGLCEVGACSWCRVAPGRVTG